jgi:hypothetical protein
MQTNSRHRVRNRRVFYIPGFDPFPPRRYRELYRREAAAQAEISDYEIAVQAAKDSDVYGWQVSATIDGKSTNSSVEVLVWSDLVRGSMSGGILATYGQMLRTIWIYVSTGALRRLMWLRKGPMIAALYPIVMLIAQALVAVSLGWIIGRSVSQWTVPALGLMLGAVVTVATANWLRKQDHRFFAYYLMHDYAYSARLRGRNPPELEARLSQFQERIKGALVSDLDEVLVVGHSSGAQHAINILADIIRAPDFNSNGPRLAFLSLGQVVPMVSFLPEATQLRADLRDLSLSDKLTWVDISAPGDGCSFALCDPVAVSGVAEPGKRWPLVISAAFSQTLSPARWKALKRRYFRLHFQYLCAFDQPGDYDYFQITAGPLSLSQRYAERAPSKSLIDLAASPYTSLVA